MYDFMGTIESQGFSSTSISIVDHVLQHLILLTYSLSIKDPWVVPHPSKIESLGLSMFH
jgi:hypothetical protein